MRWYPFRTWKQCGLKKDTPDWQIERPTVTFALAACWGLKSWQPWQPIKFWTSDVYNKIYVRINCETRGRECYHLQYLINQQNNSFMVTSVHHAPRGGCARVIDCNRSSSAHHRICTFFPTLFNLVGKGSGHVQTTRGYGLEAKSDGNKHPRGTPTFLTPVKPMSASSWSSSPRGSFSHKSLMATPTQRMQLRYVHAQPPLTCTSTFSLTCSKRTEAIRDASKGVYSTTTTYWHGKSGCGHVCDLWP